MTICLCVGTRPNFIKVAPIIRELEKQDMVYTLVHTGQHYAENMSESFFKDLGIPKPNENLACGQKHISASGRIADIMKRLWAYMVQIKPSAVVVFGDVDSSLACALTAKKSGIPVVHVEAGERSGDRTMPEEINRILIDELSDVLFFASDAAAERFAYHPNGYLVGNVMIDQLRHDESKLKEFAVRNDPYAVLTLHRAGNVDNKERLESIIRIVSKVSEKIQVFFPVHPRTKKAINKFMRRGKDIANFTFSNIILTDPMPYLEFLATIQNAKLVMTDSGGLQVETSYLNIPCITLRENTEWLNTVSRGSNVVAGFFEDDILKAVDKILAGKWKQSKFKKDPLYSGNASEQIVEILKKKGYDK